MYGEMSKAAELALRAETMAKTVELLNDFGYYLHAEENSPLEDQLEAGLDDKVATMVRAGETGMAGHVLLCLVAMVHNCADPDAVQRFLDEQSEAMIQQAKEINADQ